MSLLDTQEAAEFLKVSKKRIDALCREGRLGYVVVDRKGTKRFTEGHLTAFIQCQTVSPKQPIDKRPCKPVSSSKRGEDPTVGRQKGKGLSLKQEIESLCRQ